jgi:hypothetical protein
VPLKQRTEKRDVLVTYGVADFLHAAMITLQHPLGRSDAQFL